MSEELRERDDESTAYELVSGMSELTALLLSTRDIESSLRDLAAVASKMLPGKPMAGVSIRRAGDTVTVGATGAEASRVDEIQFQQQSGPCLEAMNSAEPVLVPDVAQERRWGDYPARVMAHGIRSIYSQPLLANGTPIGALNLYATTPNGFDEQTRWAIRLTGEHTSVLLTTALAVARQNDRTAQLRAALASRSLIDQALGIVMGQRGCTRAQAFEILRNASQNRNVKLAEIARGIIRTVTGAEPEGQPHFGEGIGQ
ncbi:GAF and ANTAR domain-containing protein [Nocardia sp. XZ_19_385]|uniref:GAF and ANTAR domain-containing protein n=1 Tax=Nocardia sp. XZ_19_385 TaxID=2769488 RepID=UPI00188DF652|nr:GAF and ANTAR domain-containing protein [Nocardia sp. XZ_19_385]